MPKFAVALVALASIAVTIATFMPMKAILILASGNVPAFFPAQMESFGPMFVATLLLIGSALFAGISWLSWKLVDKIRTEEAFINASKFSLSPEVFTPLLGVRQRKQETGSEILVSVFFGLVLLWVSPLFLVLTYSWLLSNLMWIRWRVLRKSASDPMPVVQARVSRTYRRWINRSAIVSTLGITLISLLTDQIRFEVTGALVAAILGRRLQMSFATLISQLANSNRRRGTVSAVTTKSGDSRGDLTSLVHLNDHPRVECAAEVLKYVCEQQDLEPGDLLILHANQGKAATIAAARLSRPSLVYFRVFNPGAGVMRDVEEKFRSSDAPVSLFSDQKSRTQLIENIPCIEVLVEDPIAVGHKIGQPELRKWQVELESSCLYSSEFQNWGRAAPIEFPENLYMAALEGTVRTPGAHQRNVNLLLDNSSGLNELLLNGPFVWVSEHSLRPNDFLRRLNGSLILVNPLGWRVGRWGDGKSPVLHKLNDSRTEFDTSISMREHEIAVLRGLRNELLKALLNFSFNEIHALSATMNRHFKNLSENPMNVYTRDLRVNEF